MRVSLWITLGCPLLTAGSSQGWSSLSFLSSQSNSKRSTDEIKENSLSVGEDMSVSESKLEPSALIDSEADPESRMNPYKRRKYSYRTKKRKNRYDNQASQDFYNEEKIYDDSYYDRDSSYGPPSSGYSAPTSSYEAPAYEAPSYNSPPSYKPAPTYD